MAASLGALDTGALQQAWEAHKPTLTERERKYFESFACDGLDAYLDKLVSACKAHRDAHLRTKIADWFEPVLQIVQQLMPIAQTAMSVHPIPGNLVLGGIVAIVQLAERLYEYQTKSMQMLSRMSAKMQILLTYEKDLYEDNDFVLKAITLVFGDLLKFCSKVFQFIEHRGEVHARVIGFRWTVFKDFEKQLGEIIREFDQNMEKVESRALECDKRRLKQIRATIELQAKKQDWAKDDQDENNRRANELSQRISVQTDELMKKMDLNKKAELREKVLFWLSPLRPEDRYWELAETYLEGTGTWLLQSPTYQDWKTSEGPPILWIRGKPGCGKSFLAARVILDLDLTLDHGIALAYMFCERANTDKQTRRAILGALAKQIMMCQRRITSTLDEEYLKPQRPDFPAERLIWDILKQSTISTSTTYLIVDALDECKDGEDLVKDLVRMTKDNTTVKVIVFSRDDVPLEEHLDKYPQLRPDDSSNEKDLRAYLDSILDDPDDKIELSEESRQQCVLKADGVILWVKLFRESLRNRFQRSKRLRNISAMQPGLDSRYDVILSELGHGYRDNREQAWLIFLLVTHAKSPMTASEMMELVTDDPPDIIPDLKTLHDAHWPNKHYLVGLCSNLIFIRDGYVRLSHESVRDHLEDTTCSRAAASWREEYRSFCKDPHAKLAKLCLEYLLLKDFDRGGVRTERHLQKWKRDAPFLQYAATTWGWHVAHASEQDQLKPLIKDLVYSSQRRELCLQVKLFGSVDGKLATCIGMTQPLTILAADGLTQYMKEILSTKDCVEQLLLRWNLFNSHVLVATAMSGHEEMTAFLLDLRSKIAVLDLSKDEEQKAITEYQSALRIAFTKTVVRGHTSIVHLLIEAGANVDDRGLNDTPCLVLAAMGDDLAMVQALLEKGADPNAKDNDEQTALLYAADNSNAEMARLLLLAGADPEARVMPLRMQTPLHVAALNGSASFVRVLKEYRPEFNLSMTDEDGFTPLHNTSWMGMHEAAAALLELGCEKEIKNCFGQTALYIAAQEGQLKIVEMMVKYGCNIIAPSNNQRTPLHAAAESGKQGLLQCLLARTPQDKWPKLLRIVSDNGASILHSAIIGGNLDCMDFALEISGHASAKTDHAETPLHYAAYYGVKHLVRPLVSRSREPNPLDWYEDNPLHDAARQNQVEFIKELIQVCKDLGLWLDINGSNKYKSSPLNSALNAANPQVAQLLIQEGANSTQNDSKNYPIHLAAWNGYQEIVEALLSKPGVNCRGYQNRTVLHCVASSGKTSIMQLLSAYFAEQLNAQDKTGDTPIMQALRYGHIEAANWLLDQQPNLTITNMYGESILHLAASAGDLDFLRRVLDKDCNPVAPTKFGITPLMRAVKAQKMDVIDELLVRHPGSWRTTDNTDISCLQIAVCSGNLDLLTHIEALGADIHQKDLLGWGLMHSAVDYGQFEVVVYLHLRGCSLIELDKFGDAPLALAVKGGYSMITKYILDNVDSEYIDHISEVHGQSAVWIAACYNYMPLYDMLVEVGASTMTVPDHCGISAANFLATESLGHFETADINTQRARHQAVIKCCKKLKHIGEVSIEELYRHAILTNVLTRALRRVGDFEAATLYLMERGWVPELDPIPSNRTCCFCGTEDFMGDMFLCKSCLCKTILCEACYKRYNENEAQVPQGLTLLNAIENEIEEIRKGIPPTFDLINTMKAVYWFGSSAWVDVIVLWDEQWQQDYNAEDEYDASIRPGHEFLRIISAAWKEKDKLIAVSPAAPDQEQDPTAVSLEEEYIKFMRDHPIGKLRSISECSGHDFLRISRDERDRIMADNIKLDSKWGRVTDEYLQQIITRHEAEVARIDRKRVRAASDPGISAERPPKTQIESLDLSASRPLQTLTRRTANPVLGSTIRVDEDMNNTGDKPHKNQTRKRAQTLPATWTDSAQDPISSREDDIKQLQTAVHDAPDTPTSKQAQQISTAMTSAATIVQSDNDNVGPIELPQQDREAATESAQTFADLRKQAREIVTRQVATEPIEALRAAYRELYSELIPDSELAIWGVAVRLVQKAAPAFYERYVEERQEALTEGLDERDFEMLTT